MIFTRHLRNSLYLLLFSVALYSGLVVWRLLPHNLAIFPGSALDFFKLPIANFYILLGLGWIDLLLRLGLIPLISVLLTLGVIWTATRDAGTIWTPSWYASLLLFMAQILLFFFSIQATLPPALPRWPAVMLAAIFGWLRLVKMGDYS